MLCTIITVLCGIVDRPRKIGMNHHQIQHNSNCYFLILSISVLRPLVMSRMGSNVSGCFLESDVFQYLTLNNSLTTHMKIIVFKTSQIYVADKSRSKFTSAVDL